MPALRPRERGRRLKEVRHETPTSGVVSFLHGCLGANAGGDELVGDLRLKSPISDHLSPIAEEA